MSVSIWPWLAVLVSALGCSGSRELAPPVRGLGRPAETRAFLEPLWDDGRAEVARYRAVEDRYGILRDGEAILIVVKEPFDLDRLVKADGTSHAHVADVMKLNWVRTHQTGVYTYRQMASAFLLRDGLRPLKLVTSSQEWCGITTKILTVRGDDALLRTFSYFGDEAEGSFRVPLGEEVVLYDALPLWIRSLELDRPRRIALRVLAPELSNHGRAPSIEDASLAIGELASVTVPAGAYETVPVTLTRGERRDVFHLATEAPHVLVRWDRADGGTYELLHVERAAYWDMNGPEDVGALLPPAPQPAETPPPQPAVEPAP